MNSFANICIEHLIINKSKPTMPTPSAMSNRMNELATINYTEKVDLWSVGVIMFTILQGKAPYDVRDSKKKRRMMTAENIAWDERFWTGPLSDVGGARNLVQLLLKHV